MKPLHLQNALLAMVSAAVLILPFEAFTASSEPPTTPGQEVSAPAENAVPEDLPGLRYRYRHDATGVRARLGMCRRGHGGPHGNGQHEHFDDVRGPGRGRHQRCPLDAPQEHTP